MHIRGAYPYYIIDTTNLDKQCMMSIVKNKNKSITLAWEVKVSTICMQNYKKDISSMVVIVARL